MTEGIKAIFCGDCGKQLNELQMLPTEARLPCPACGSMKRHVTAEFTATVTATVGMRVIGKASGVKKTFVEVRAEPSIKKSTGETVFHERTIDRRNDRYLEKVTLKSTGEVLHECDEKLSDHTNHGCARKPEGPDGTKR